jgi:hypothetical protein
MAGPFAVWQSKTILARFAEGESSSSQPSIRRANPMWIADAHRDDGKRFVVHADEKLTAFVELESAVRGGQRLAAAIVRSGERF